MVSILVLILDNTKSVLPCNLFFSKACGFFLKKIFLLCNSVVGMVSLCLGTENIWWHMFTNEHRISASSYLCCGSKYLIERLW